MGSGFEAGVGACFGEDPGVLPSAVSRLLFSGLCFTPWAPRGAVPAALTTAAMISLIDTQRKRSPRDPRLDPRTPVARARLARPTDPVINERSSALGSAACQTELGLRDA